jgi:hypothetical protein
MDNMREKTGEDPNPLNKVTCSCFVDEKIEIKKEHSIKSSLIFQKKLIIGNVRG